MENHHAVVDYTGGYSSQEQLNALVVAKPRFRIVAAGAVLTSLLSWAPSGSARSIALEASDRHQRPAPGLRRASRTCRRLPCLARGKRDCVAEGHAPTRAPSVLLDRRTPAARLTHQPLANTTRMARMGNRGSRDLPSCCRARVGGDARVAGLSGSSRAPPGRGVDRDGCFVQEARQ
jgi:hypothetical protein